MFSKDVDFKGALKRMFSTTFFDNMPYKNSFKRYDRPVYISSLAGTGEKVGDNYYVYYFYNKKINIDFENTIVVKEEHGKIKYDFHENMPANERLYYDVYIDNDGNKIYAGTKFKEVII